MPRVKRVGQKRRARRKKLLKHAKGFFLTKGKLYRSAKEAVNRSLRYTYRDRRVRKRDYRTLWIQRIGAAARANGLSYSQLIHGLKAGGDRSRSQDPGGHGRGRHGRLCRSGRLGEDAPEVRGAQSAPVQSHAAVNLRGSVSLIWLASDRLIFPDPTDPTSAETNADARGDLWAFATTRGGVRNPVADSLEAATSRVSIDAERASRNPSIPSAGRLSSSRGPVARPAC